MRDPLTVFISSVIAGMEAERAAAQAAIQVIPLSRPWLFEFSPASSLSLEESYLSKVRDCDIFILLLGATITDPVKKEVGRAQAAGKPLLVFLSASAPADMVKHAQWMGVKYATHQTATDLAAKVAEAVTDELVAGYRRHQVSPADLGGFLDRLAQGQVRIDTGGGAVAERVDTGGGDFIGRDQFVQYVFNVYRAPAGKGKMSDADLKRILGEYLRWVRDAYDHARLFGMESAPTARSTPRPDLT
jgi:hypothetical protein